MEVSSPGIDELPSANRPLKIIVSEAGQTAALKALVAQCVPVLRSPEAFSLERRRELAQRLTHAIQPRGFMEEMDECDACCEPAEEQDPFCWTEDDQ